MHYLIVEKISFFTLIKKNCNYVYLFNFPDRAYPSHTQTSCSLNDKYFSTPLICVLLNNKHTRILNLNLV